MLINDYDRKIPRNIELNKWVRGIYAVLVTFMILIPSYAVFSTLVFYVYELRVFFGTPTQWTFIWMCICFIIISSSFYLSYTRRESLTIRSRHIGLTMSCIVAMMIMSISIYFYHFRYKSSCTSVSFVINFFFPFLYVPFISRSLRLFFTFRNINDHELFFELLNDTKSRMPGSVPPKNDGNIQHLSNTQLISNESVKYNDGQYNTSEHASLDNNANTVENAEGDDDDGVALRKAALLALEPKPESYIFKHKSLLFGDGDDDFADSNFNYNQHYGLLGNESANGAGYAYNDSDFFFDQREKDILAKQKDLVAKQNLRQGSSVGVGSVGRNGKEGNNKWSYKDSSYNDSYHSYKNMSGTYSQLPPHTPHSHLPQSPQTPYSAQRVGSLYNSQSKKQQHSQSHTPSELVNPLRNTTHPSQNAQNTQNTQNSRSSSDLQKNPHKTQKSSKSSKDLDSTNTKSQSPDSLPRGICVYILSSGSIGVERDIYSQYDTRQSQKTYYQSASNRRMLVYTILCTLPLSFAFAISSSFIDPSIASVPHMCFDWVTVDTSVVPITNGIMNTLYLFVLFLSLLISYSSWSIYSINVELLLLMTCEGLCLLSNILSITYDVHYDMNIIQWLLSFRIGVVIFALLVIPILKYSNNKLAPIIDEYTKLHLNSCVELLKSMPPSKISQIISKIKRRKKKKSQKKKMLKSALSSTKDFNSRDSSLQQDIYEDFEDGKKAPSSNNNSDKTSSLKMPFLDPETLSSEQPFINPDIETGVADSTADLDTDDLSWIDTYIVDSTVPGPAPLTNHSLSSPSPSPTPSTLTAAYRKLISYLLRVRSNTNISLSPHLFLYYFYTFPLFRPPSLDLLLHTPLSFANFSDFMQKANAQALLDYHIQTNAILSIARELYNTFKRDNFIEVSLAQSFHMCCAEYNTLNLSDSSLLVSLLPVFVKGTFVDSLRHHGFRLTLLIQELKREEEMWNTSSPSDNDTYSRFPDISKTEGPGSLSGVGSLGGSITMANLYANMSQSTGNFGNIGINVHLNPNTSANTITSNYGTIIDLTDTTNTINTTNSQNQILPNSTTSSTTVTTANTTDTTLHMDTMMSNYDKYVADSKIKPIAIGKPKAKSTSNRNSSNSTNSVSSTSSNNPASAVRSMNSRSVFTPRNNTMSPSSHIHSVASPSNVASFSLNNHSSPGDKQAHSEVDQVQVKDGNKTVELKIEHKSEQVKSQGAEQARSLEVVHNTDTGVSSIGSHPNFGLGSLGLLPNSAAQGTSLGESLAIFKQNLENFKKSGIQDTFLQQVEHDRKMSGVDSKYTDNYPIGSNSRSYSANYDGDDPSQSVQYETDMAKHEEEYDNTDLFIQSLLDMIYLLTDISHTVVREIDCHLLKYSKSRHWRWLYYRIRYVNHITNLLHSNNLFEKIEYY